MLQYNRVLGKVKLLLLCISDLLKPFQTYGEIDCFLLLMEIELSSPAHVFINKLDITSSFGTYVEAEMCVHRGYYVYYLNGSFSKTAGFQFVILNLCNFHHDFLLF